MMDIDHFKLINDHYGHPVGDRVIRKLAYLLMGSFRKTDFIGRYGGEEFAVVLPNTTKQNALTICEKLRKKMEECLFNADDKSFHVTISIGIASFPDVQETQNLVFYADEALYDAKEKGRNRCVVFQGQTL
jgi:diguanylate cyclase (GGDEF)-like protein